MADCLQAFFFENLPVRGALVHLGDSLNDLLDARGYPDALAGLLGESAAATTLIASTLKSPGRLTLQIAGNGPLRMLAMQCRDSLDFRGMALVGESWANEQRFVDVTDGARCTVTIASDNIRERYQGIVEVAGVSLAESLDHFFVTSIQVPTRFWLAAVDGQSVGLMLQVVAGHEGFVTSDDWRRLALLAETLTLDEVARYGLIGMLQRLFAEDDLRLPAQRSTRFFCECSRERAANAVKMLGEQDANEAVTEQGQLVVTCEYCGTERTFSPFDVAALFSAVAPSTTTH
ncbi:MAG: Hsp33 family molecular chaperone HslO [Pseudomonadota bacterium]